MDFAKFVALLRNSSLYFSRIDAMQDGYEGAIPKGHAARLVGAFERLSNGNEAYMNKVGILRKTLEPEYYERTRRSVLVNCWHLNSYESGAMWKVYGDNSIAIQSTFGKLRDSFDSVDDPEINIGTVQYIDFEDENFALQPLSSVLCKRPLYAFENELRAIIYSSNNGRIESTLPGQNVRVALDSLIENVYIGPGRARWFVELIRDLLNEHSLIDAPVIRSGMDKSPIFA